NPNGWRAIRLTVPELTSTGWSTRRRSRRISQWSTSRSTGMGPSVGKTSPSTRGGTFTFVRPARFSPRRASWSMMGRPFSISREHATVVAAHSRRSAAQRLLSAESSEASTRRPVTWHGRWPKPKHSSDRVAIANVLRCCLHISSVSFGSVVCACADHVVLSSSSHWRQSRKTSAGSQNSSSDHRRSHKCALHNEGRVRGGGGGPCLARGRGSRTRPGSGADDRQLLEYVRARRHAPVVADFCNKIGQ